MKEVTGELNLTVIVAIAVGILATFFFMFMWPAVHANFQRTSDCRRATCDCSTAKDNDYMCVCWIGNNTGNTFTCPFGG